MVFPDFGTEFINYNKESDLKLKTYIDAYTDSTSIGQQYYNMLSVTISKKQLSYRKTVLLLMQIIGSMFF